MDRIVNMILRRIIGRGVNMGIRSAVNWWQRDKEVSPEAQQHNRQAQNNIRQMRRSTRLLRRIGKF